MPTQGQSLSVQKSSAKSLVFSQAQTLSRGVAGVRNFINSTVTQYQTPFFVKSAGKLLSNPQGAFFHISIPFRLTINFVQTSAYSGLKFASIIRPWTQAQIGRFSRGAGNNIFVFSVAQTQGLNLLKAVSHSWRVTQAQQLAGRSSRALVVSIAVIQAQAINIIRGPGKLIPVQQATIYAQALLKFSNHFVTLVLSQVQVLSFQKAVANRFLYIANGIPPFIQGGQDQLALFVRRISSATFVVTETFAQSGIFSLVRNVGKNPVWLQGQALLLLKSITAAKAWTVSAVNSRVKAITHPLATIAQASSFTQSILTRVHLVVFSVVQSQTLSFSRNISALRVFISNQQFVLLKNIVHTAILLGQAAQAQLLKLVPKSLPSTQTQASVIGQNKILTKAIAWLSGNQALLTKGFSTAQLWVVQTSYTVRNNLARVIQFFSDSLVGFVPSFTNIRFAMRAQALRIYGSQIQPHKRKIIAKLRKNFFDIR